MSDAVLLKSKRLQDNKMQKLSQYNESESDDANVKEISSDDSNCFNLYTDNNQKLDQIDFGRICSSIQQPALNQEDQYVALLKTIGFGSVNVIEQLDNFAFIKRIFNPCDAESNQ